MVTTKKIIHVIAQFINHHLSDLWLIFNHNCTYLFRLTITVPICFAVVWNPTFGPLLKKGHWPFICPLHGFQEASAALLRSIMLYYALLFMDYWNSNFVFFACDLLDLLRYQGAERLTSPYQKMLTVTSFRKFASQSHSITLLFWFAAITNTSQPRLPLCRHSSFHPTIQWMSPHPF